MRNNQTEANKKLHNTKLNEIKAEFLNNAMKLVLQGYISITNQKHRNNPELDKPKTTKMVIHSSNPYTFYVGYKFKT